MTNILDIPNYKAKNNLCITNEELRQLNSEQIESLEDLYELNLEACFDSEE